jgi:hypothetical protein
VTRRLAGDNGSVMPMAVILITFLMVGAWALVSASQQWTARRDAYAVAAAAARAGAQTDPMVLRAGGLLDADGATARARQVLTATGHHGTVTVDGQTVTVVVTATVGYAFPSPGFPATVTGTATAAVRAGVDGTEAGG